MHEHSFPGPGFGADTPGKQMCPSLRGFPGWEVTDRRQVLRMRVGADPGALWEPRGDT